MPRSPSLTTLRATLQRLNLKQKRSLLLWLQEAIDATHSSEETALDEEQAEFHIPASKHAAVGNQRHYEGRLYRQERRRCGKAGCRCEQGQLAEVGHGPYWYAYWKEQGRLRSQYVGKRVPWESETDQRKG